MAELPYADVDIQTPTGDIYKGKAFQDRVCGVSVVRAGASMETALRSVIKDIPIGKILIQTDHSKGEPVLHYCKLPPDISNRYVLVADAQIATGAAAVMALRVIVDHHVPQEKIIFMSLLASPMGLATIRNAFPNVKVIVSAVDKEVTDNYHIRPGFGNFGDRYFGTFE